MQKLTYSGGSASAKKGIWDRVLNGEFKFWILVGWVSDVRRGQIAVRLKFNLFVLIIPPDQLTAITNLITAELVGDALTCVRFYSVHQVMK